MSDKETLVSCIMPTYNRRAFVPHAIRYFLRQDYPDKELIIIDDGTDNISDLVPVNDNIRYYRLDKKITLGAKMNLACQYAKGDIIANWDDDDWYAERRLSYQVNALKQKEIAVCGINKLYYYDLGKRTGYQYVYPPTQRVWLLGSSLCFTRELWKKNIFADINVGMDGLFVWATPPEKVKVLEDPSFSVHMIHPNNVSPKNTSSGYWHPYPVEHLQKIMDADWHCYINDGFYDEEKVVTVKTKQPAKKRKEEKLLRNVYACLVHENEDCIIDLVQNLHYHDPESMIILYNGGEDPALLKDDMPYDKMGVAIHPSPVPQKHGYLHKFALDCMEYALKNFSFDTLTIVDSDQLCTRRGYSPYLGKFLSGSKKIGMLSSRPERVLANNTVNLVAAQAFKEYELWKPLLKKFPGGENKFVHWTFWPSTVFTFPAIRDLVALFKENVLLQQIMQQTKIWATEEVIFPTLVRLLGYEIVANPCNYNYVKYRKKFTRQDVDNAINDTGAFWIHPVERRYDDHLRSYARKQFNDYCVENSTVSFPPRTAAGISTDSELIKKLRTINGWMSDAEARVLIEITRKLFSTGSGIKNIVEIGSYHGRSTVLFGSVINACAGPGKVYAIDIHDGKLGDADRGLRSYPPSFEMFKKNIEEAALTEVVAPIKKRSLDVNWELPIALLFIDGLHDYNNVSTDFLQFSDCVVKGGYIAFHDYADYFPGVKKLVHEILDSGEYAKIKQAESLIILQKT